MKKILFFSLVFSVLLSSHAQVLPVFEGGQRIIQVSAGLSPTYYNFDISYTCMGYDDIFGVENLNFGLTETMGFFISNPFPSSGLSLDGYGISFDGYGCLHYTVAERFALMGQAGLSLNSTENSMFSFIYYIGAEYSITEQFGVFVKGKYIHNYLVNFGLYLIF